MTAKPIVEPIARCALMIPEAMPARLAGTLVIASDVIGVPHSAKPNPAAARPTAMNTGWRAVPTISITIPAIMIASPTRIGITAPIRPTRCPASGAAISIARLNGSRKSPVSTGENPRTFCRYCVVISSMP